MKTKKKIVKLVAFIVTVIFAFSLATACGGTESTTTDDTSTDTSTDTSADRDYILIGVPNPTTGALAGFGDGTPWVENLAISAVNDAGGIYIEDLDASLPIQIKVVDTESDSTTASEVASQLILEDEVDMIVVRHTPDVVKPVAAICERYGVPCISMDCGLDAWLTGGPYEWCFHAFFDSNQAAEVYLALWEQVGITDCVAGILMPNDSDGTTWSATFNEFLPEHGYTVVDGGRFSVGTQDYSEIINQFKEAGVELVVACGINPDFAAFWKQCAQLGFQPKFVTSAKAYLFESDALAIGADLANGLTTEVWWSPWHPYTSSIDGMTAQELCDMYTADSGRTWTPPLGYKYAAMEIAIDALQRAASLDKEAIRDAILETNLDTIAGNIQWDEDHACHTPLVAGQWVKTGEDAVTINIVNSDLYPEIPTTGDPIYPIPY